MASSATSNRTASSIASAAAASSSSSPSSSSSSSRSPAQMVERQFRKAGELEKLLLTSAQSKGPFDQNVRLLRDNIIKLYESILLENHEFAEAHEVEQSLWRLHYTQIEEFRSRIRKSLPPVPSSNTTSLSSTGSKNIVKRESNQKILAVFRSFLSEATGFYHDLVLKIRAKHGLPQDDFTCTAVESKNGRVDDKRVQELKRCQLSCHRCLIYLGDLARYKEIHGDSSGQGDAKIHDWSIAAGFYVKAASIWPASGNPHNQLAVMATYIGDEMLAVYHYFRSLAAESPFFTAKDNLVLLFEKNRQSYLRLTASTGKPSSTLRNSVKVAKGEKNMAPAVGSPSDEQSDQSSVAPSTNAAEILKSFRIHIVRVNGILFTRTSLETFPEVHSCVLSGLEQILSFKSNDAATFRQNLTAGVWGTGPNVVLQLITILIFSVHNVNVGPDGHQPTYAEMLQQSVILEHAFIATFEYAGHLLQHSIDSEDASTSLTLPAVLVVMEWLSGRAEVAMGIEVKENEGKARSFFWKKSVDLLNRFIGDDVNRHELKKALQDDWQEELSLWEDHELRGFTPLLHLQEKLDYTRKPSPGLGSEKEKLARVQRLIKAAKLISKIFKDTEKGIHYDDQTDRFYLGSDRKRLEMKRDDIILTNIKSEPCIEPIIEPKNNYATEQESSIRMSGLSGEDDDEEVIVFQPSIKLKEHIVLSDVDGIKKNEESLYGPISNGHNDLTVPIRQQMPSEKTTSEVPSFLAGIGKLLPDVSPSMAPTPPLPVGITNLHASPMQPVSMTSGSTSVLSVMPSAANLNSNLGSNFGPSELVLSTSAAVESVFPRSGSYDNHLPARSFIDWRAGTGTGLGIFQNQQPWSSISPTITWQSQNLPASSFWNPDLNKFSASGIQSNSFNVHPVIRPPSEDMSASLSRNLIPTNSQSNGMPTYAPVSSLLDGSVQSRLASQASKHLTKDSIPGALQDLNLTNVNPKSRKISGLSDRENARKAPVPSAVRPPPGFGPLPAKSSNLFSSISAFQSTAMQSGQTGTINLDSRNPVQGASSVDEQVDDYGWLDGYSPLKKNPGQGKTTGSAAYGWLPGNSVQQSNTLPSFLGMGLTDTSSAISISTLQAQQDPIKKLQMNEHYQQQLLLEQHRHQLQQLYNARMLSQSTPQHQQQQVPPLPEQLLPLQRKVSAPSPPVQQNDVS